MEASQQDQTHGQPQNNKSSSLDPKQDFFAFLKTDEKTKPTKSSSPSFFSENGLDQDIIQVTQAEPDIPLEVFYALYHVLWPQIEKQSDISLTDAWNKFIGGSVNKGSLYPPEKLIVEKKGNDLKSIMSGSVAENQIFQDLDRVLASILNLKQKIENYPREISHKKEVIESLTLAEEFYQNYRNKVKKLVQTILEKEKMNAANESETGALEELLEPKAVMMSDIFPDHWAYRISRNRAQKILSVDPSGHHLKKHQPNHRVVSLPENTEKPLVFFKENGNPLIQLEKEFMLSSLYRHLQIPVPETATLIITDVFEANPDYFYAVQASEAVLGESPLEAYQNPETTFDHEAYVSQVVGAFLTNPSDGSFQNFKYSPKYKTLISIDNDKAFKPEQELNGKNDKEIIHVKSILYLLPQIDLPIPDSIKTIFTTLDPHLTTLSWLQDLSQKNREYRLLFTRLVFQRTRCIYQNLLPQSETPSLETCLQQKVLVDKELRSDLFKPQILVSQNLLNKLIEKFRIIEKVLSSNRPVSTQTLFEEIFPILGKYYRKLRSEFSDIEEAHEALWHSKKNDLEYSYLLSSEELTENHNVELPEGVSPETFLEEYKSLLASEASPLDRFIGRHAQRKNKKALNLQVALSELQLLVQEGLTNSQSLRDIIDFCHSLLSQKNDPRTQEILFLLHNLPDPEFNWLFSLEKFFSRTEDTVPSSLTVKGAFMKQRKFALTESESQYLFDHLGNINKNPSLTGRLNVTYFPESKPEFYLKQYPEWPGYEFASISLMRLLGVKHLPYQDLLIINNSPILLTQNISGDPVFHKWHNPQAFQNLDPFHTTLLIISAMLLNPEDGKEDNYILSPDEKYLIPIDNDHCFLPSTFQKEGSFWNPFAVNNTALQTKTLLFCLNEMNHVIPAKVQQHILALNFDKLLTSWLANLDKLETKLNNLIDQNQRNQFLQQGTVMRIPFDKHFIQNLHWKAHKIQDVLRISPNPTPFDLLKAVEPFVARCYQNSFKQGKDLQSIFKAATNNLYKKAAIGESRVSIINTKAMMKIINTSEKDLQSGIMFQKMGPVDALELLNQLIKERQERVPKEQELLFELDEKKQEDLWISLFGNPAGEATALKDFFANPKEGLALKGSKLISSSRLTEQGMKVRFLSLQENPSLTSKEMRIIIEGCPNVEYLNVSRCLKLKEICMQRGEWPLLARIDAKGCVNLEKFVSDSPIKILQVETNQAEIEISLEKSTALELFSLKKEEIEFEFSFKKGEIPNLTSRGERMPLKNFFQLIIRGREEVLKYFQSFGVNLQIPFVLSGKIFEGFLTSIDLANSNVQPGDFQRMLKLNLGNLNKLNLSRNEVIGLENLRCLIQADWPKLNHLNLSQNPQISDKGVEILSQGNWPLLETLNLSNTKITPIAVETLVNQQTHWPNLKHLNLAWNKIGDEALEILSQANWPLLETLTLNQTNISKKKILYFVLNNTKWENLKEVDYDSTMTKNLLRKNWHLLENLDLSRSEISQDDIEFIVKTCNWPNLKHLDLSWNKIGDEGLEILSQADWPLLETLTLNSTNISKKKMFHWVLNNAKWENLQQISFNSIGKNAASNLLPKNWHLLEDLDLSRAQITQDEIELMISKYPWSQLKNLDLSFNELYDEGLEILSRGNWPLLEALSLAGTKITTIGVKTLANKAQWPQLKHLSLSKNKVQDEGIEALAKGNWLSLGTLNLSQTHITDKGIKTLVSQAKWTELKCLDLSENEISDEGLAVLCQGNWPLLEKLELKGTKIMNKSLLSKANWPNWKKISLPDD